MNQRTMNNTVGVIVGLLALSLLATSDARADSVAQIGTSIRISRGTATLIDPQGRPGVIGTGTDTAAQPGDVLSFIVHFTPVPNGAVRGLGGYVTVYIPRNTEVVGARIVDAAGLTIPPHRGGLASDGVGPRGTVTYAAPLVGGSLSQLYADTGIFYSTDARTARFPDGSAAGSADDFLTLFDGIALAPSTTAFGQLAPILGAGATGYAHNQWDVIQALGFGINGGAINPRGTGNTADLYGSAVAGPDTWYPNEASYTGSLAAPLTVANVAASGTVGPWIRVQTMLGETGRRGAVPPVPNPGLPTRIGVVAEDGTGRPNGVQLDGDHALPAYDTASPATPYTRAVRFAVGELVVGDEYLVEVSLRVLATPLDPVNGKDIVCAEVFGGDASSRSADGTQGGKDNTWRYFLPAPSCVSLPLLFELDVNHLIALTGDRLTYTLHGKNLATAPQTNVVARHCFTAGDLNFVAASGGGVLGTGVGCPNAAAQNDVSWAIGTLDPGEEYTFTIDFDIAGGARTTTGRAIYTSDQLPAPGFSTIAFTDITALTILDLAMTATPALVLTPPGTVAYHATITNRGTGNASPAGCTGGTCRAVVTLPAGFTYVAGSTTIGGVAAANPAIASSTHTFTAGLTTIAPGATLAIDFSATVPVGTTPGAYTSSLETALQDVGAGQTVADARVGLAEVVVGVARSEPPTITEPLFAGAVTVNGTSSEPAGSTIRVFLRGIAAGSGVSGAGGAFGVTVPTLFVGERVTATAQAVGELESLPSAEVGVSGVGSVLACSDGIDNDLDGLVDFPDDPGCFSATDLDEESASTCADGLDNDADGLVDFGADPGCSSLLDDTEDGDAECGNGLDDDADGLADFPADPGCTSATDVSERDVPACANGLDDDADGTIDYPLDPGCSSASDDDETAAIAVVDAGPPIDLDAGTAAEPSVGIDGGGVIFDHGGVPDPGSGCGCRVAAASRTSGTRPMALLGALLVLAGVVSRRRRR